MAEKKINIPTMQLPKAEIKRREALERKALREQEKREKELALAKEKEAAKAAKEKEAKKKAAKKSKPAKAKKEKVAPVEATAPAVVEETIAPVEIIEAPAPVVPEVKPMVIPTVAAEPAKKHVFRNIVAVVLAMFYAVVMVFALINTSNFFPLTGLMHLVVNFKVAFIDSYTVLIDMLKATTDVITGIEITLTSVAFVTTFTAIIDILFIAFAIKGMRSIAKAIKEDKETLPVKNMARVMVLTALGIIVPMMLVTPLTGMLEALLAVKDIVISIIVMILVTILAATLNISKEEDEGRAHRAKLAVGGSVIAFVMTLVMSCAAERNASYLPKILDGIKEMIDSSTFIVSSFVGVVAGALWIAALVITMVYMYRAVKQLDTKEERKGVNGLGITAFILATLLFAVAMFATPVLNVIDSGNWEFAYEFEKSTNYTFMMAMAIPMLMVSTSSIASKKGIKE